MSKFKKSHKLATVLVATAAVAAVSTVAATQASATEMVNPFNCTFDVLGKGEYATVFFDENSAGLGKNKGPACFRDAGTWQGNLTQAVAVRSGNNIVTVKFEPAGPNGGTVVVGRNMQVNLPGLVTVKEISIK